MNWAVSYFNERVQREIAEWPVGIYADRELRTARKRLKEVKHAE